MRLPSNLDTCYFGGNMRNSMRMAWTRAHVTSYSTSEHSYLACISW